MLVHVKIQLPVFLLYGCESSELEGLVEYHLGNDTVWSGSSYRYVVGTPLLDL